MITSRSHFKALIDIPNVRDTAPNSNLIGNGKKLDLFIDKYERELLIQCLGYSLATEFVNELDPSTPNGLKTTSDIKWDDLLNGKEYLLNDVLVKWRGFKYKQGDLEESIPSYYIFCEFLRKDVLSYRGTGVQKEKTKNSINVSSDSYYIDAFREFHKLIEFSNCSNDNYGFRSLYDFIQDMNNINIDTYSNWHPKRFKNQNTFGI